MHVKFMRISKTLVEMEKNIVKTARENMKTHVYAKLGLFGNHFLATPGDAVASWEGIQGAAILL